MKTQSRLRRAFAAVVIAAVTVVMSSFGSASIASAHVQSGAAASSTKRIPMASGFFVCSVFYFTINMGVPGSTFVGNGGGLFSASPGTLVGDIYTDDEARFFRDTVSFQVNVFGSYINVNFFDSNSKLLGSLQAYSFSACGGIGGGAGRWL